MRYALFITNCSDFPPEPDAFLKPCTMAICITTVLSAIAVRAD